jgi:polar amino acid transport system permease protein
VSFSSVLLAAFPELLHGAITTIELTLCSAFVSLVIGMLSAMLQLSGLVIGYWSSRAYVSVMRGTPLLVQLFVVFFGLPLIGIRGEAFLAAMLAFGLNSGAYVTEILRAAVLHVPSGQVEAAATIGMARVQIWRRVIMPQALATSLPALTNEFTILLKSTPLASVVAVTDLTFAGQLIIARSYQPVTVLSAVASGYIVVALLFTQLARWAERKLALFHT